MEMNWYLIRTKAGEEGRAKAQIARLATDLLLPLAKVHVRRWGRMAERVVPLFPCYVFALFDLELASAALRYTRAVRGVVYFGDSPAIVPSWIINGLQQRCAHGPVDLRPGSLEVGERVVVVDGPFREFEGIFEQYRSGAARVGILMRVMGRETHVEMPAHMVMRKS